MDIAGISYRMRVLMYSMNFGCRLDCFVLSLESASGAVPYSQPDASEQGRKPQRGAPAMLSLAPAVVLKKTATAYYGD